MPAAGCALRSLTTPGSRVRLARCRRGWVAISAGRVNTPVSGPSRACMSPGRLPRLIARRSRGTWHLASGAGTSWPAWPRCPPCCAGCPAPATAQPSGDSAAVHERDAGEALLGRVLSRMVARRRRRRRARGAVAAVLAGAAVAGWALRPGSPPSGPAASGTVLQAETIGVSVLADAAGFTVYWFACDTAARSDFTGISSRGPGLRMSGSRRWPALAR
jgi:hypothetical protein